MAQDVASAITVLRGMTAKFDNAVKAASPYYPKLAMTVPSKGANEQYGFLGRVPQVREWDGERDFKQLRGTQWTLTNKPWEQSLLIEKSDIADDRLGMYFPMLQQLGTRAAKHPDKLLFDLIIAGEEAACFDGQYYFDTDHVWGDSGTQSNDLTHDATDHTSVTAAEFKLAYNAAIRALMGFKDDQGELLNTDIFDEAQSITVVVPPVLLQQAHDALTVKLGANGGDNVVITRPEIVASARLTSAVKFYVFKTDEALRPFIFQAREPLKRQMKNQNDLEWKEVKFMTQARYVMGYGAWWTTVLTTFN